jgi:tetratricopeptide (TPR) repeat protein
MTTRELLSCHPARVRDKSRWQEASHLNDLGLELTEHNKDAEAKQKFTLAIEKCPDYGTAWFNLGLAYKRSHEWAESARCFERVVDLDGTTGDPAWWNLGIAATALRDWTTARRAWTEFGIEIPPGEGELRMQLDTVPIRVGRDDFKEVNWCDRIDPARGIIMNVPHPATGRSWRDIVLHDGAPNGEREIDGHIVPVFDEIEVWEPSNIPTTMFEVELAEPEDADELKSLFSDQELVAEDFTTNSRVLCKRCSEGRPIPGHTHEAESPPNARTFGIAGPPEVTRALVTQWAGDGSGRRAIETE